MLTFSDYHKEKMKDPDFKREYDALEGWYQAELAKQEALDRAEKAASPSSTTRKRQQPACVCSPFLSLSTLNPPAGQRSPPPA